MPLPKAHGIPQPSGMKPVRELHLVLLGAWLLLPLGSAPAAEPQPITFNKAFEGASLGKIEKLDDTSFRLHVEGQYDERGRNRQTTWFYFRMDHVAGRELTLTFTDWVGEYNDKPGACPMGPTLQIGRAHV